MNSDYQTLSRIIRHRRSVYPQQVVPGTIPEELVDGLISNACWAPNHKKTEPWRFVRIRGEKLKDLSAFLSDFYRENTPAEKFSELKWKKAGERPLQSAYVLALCLERSPGELIPAWEETAALACAVQNLWLACSALGIGAYWSTPEAIRSLGRLFDPTGKEECLGLFYMGWAPAEVPDSSRRPVEEVSRFW
jgi:nitroreductase